MMKKLLLFSFILLGITGRINAFTLPFQYFEKYNYTSGSFTSNETVFTDISDSGLVCGYYLNSSGGYSGLIYFKNGKTLSYDYAGYSNVQFTGINDSGYIAGRAYNSTSSAVVIRAKLVDNAITNVTAITYWGSGTYLSPQRLNNDNVLAGSLHTGSTYWLNYASVAPPSTISGTDRYEYGSTQYNTYGLGIADAVDSSVNCGYYIDDNNDYQPFLFYPYNATFYYFNPVSSSGIFKTKFNDINNSNYIAVSYKDANGYMQGTVASVFAFDVLTSAATVNYYTGFPFTGAQGSEVLGINNHNDIAGYFKDADGVTTAYIATVSEFKIPKFKVPDNVLNFENSSVVFKNSTYQQPLDYLNSDPYLHDNTVSFYNQYIEPLNGSTTQKLAIRDSGDRYPTWVQYVSAVSEDSAYKVINGIKTARPEAINQWLHYSRKTFPGYCYGMCLFAGQYFNGEDVLVNRFSNFVPSLDVNIYQPGVPNWDDIKDDIGALQLYQHALQLQGAKQRFDAISQFYSPGNYAALLAVTKPIIDSMTRHFYDTAAYDSTVVLCIKGHAVDDDEEFRHALYPYKLTRNMDINNYADTVYCLDPNKPNSYVKVVFNYPDSAIYSTDANDNVANAYFVEVALPFGQLAKVNIGSHAVLSKGGRKPAPTTALAKTNGSYTQVNTGDACNYRVEDAGNVTSYFEQMATGITNNFSGMYTDLIMDEDDRPDALAANQVLNIKSTLSQDCGGYSAWNYSYANGDMIYSRDSTVAGQSDIVYNNANYMKAENPDAVVHTVAMTAITTSGTEESYVKIDSFGLQPSDTAAVTVEDYQHIHLANGETTDKYYNLYVRYLGDNGVITRTMNGIHIWPNTNHTIVIQPQSANQKVIILVDSLQDGSVNDTIVVDGAPARVISALYPDVQVSIYPNPAHSVLNISVQNFNAQWQYSVVDMTGRILLKGSNISAVKQLPVSKLSAGMYWIEIADDKGIIINRSHFVKE